jgi:RluA family pseudouridine synthase
MVESLLGKRTREEALLPEEEEIKESTVVPTYEIKNGLRFVAPYDYEFKAFAKRRWIGQTLLSVYKDEFMAFSQSYYTDAIGSGKITVNDLKVTCDYKIKDGDRITHHTRREETPVLADLPQVVYEDDSLVAFNKPCSIPVHPCGNFFYNSMEKLLELELGRKGLKSVHRLDR